MGHHYFLSFCRHCLPSPVMNSLTFSTRTRSRKRQKNMRRPDIREVRARDRSLPVGVISVFAPFAAHKQRADAEGRTRVTFGPSFTPDLFIVKGGGPSSFLAQPTLRWHWQNTPIPPPSLRFTIIFSPSLSSCKTVRGKDAKTRRLCWRVRVSVRF